MLGDVSLLSGDGGGKHFQAIGLFFQLWWGGLFCSV